MCNVYTAGPDLTPCDKVPRRSLEESLWCRTCSQPQAVLVNGSKHAFPLAVLILLKTNSPLVCQSFLPLPPHSLPLHTHTPSPTICQPSPVKFSSRLAFPLSTPGLLWTQDTHLLFLHPHHQPIAIQIHLTHGFQIRISKYL